MEEADDNIEGHFIDYISDDLVEIQFDFDLLLLSLHLLFSALLCIEFIQTHYLASLHFY